MSSAFSLKAILAVALLSLGLGLAAPAARAADPAIEAAKSAGVVGERIDGYLGIVDPTAIEPATLRKVEEVNAKRRAVYADLATRSGQTIEVVARLTGEKQFEAASPGEYVMDASGRWVQKN